MNMDRYAGDSAGRTSLPRITLASASPRRREILARLGIPLVVRAAHAAEETITVATVPPSPDPHEACRRVTLERARLKAASVAPDPTTSLALSADTTVDINGRILDKPADEAEARLMMQNLSGATHQVHSAVILYDDPVSPERWLQELVTSHVTFRPLTPEDLTWYFAPCDGEEPEWMGVAGGYRIQGRAGAFVQHLQGSYEAVMGLPIHTVYSMIRRFCAGFPG